MKVFWFFFSKKNRLLDGRCRDAQAKQESASF
jgi:hypothetical protein